MSEVASASTRGFLRELSFPCGARSNTPLQQPKPRCIMSAFSHRVRGFAAERQVVSQHHAGSLRSGDAFILDQRSMATFSARAVVLVTAALLGSRPAWAQHSTDSISTVDSATRTDAVPVWRNRVRYGGGPSVGAPPSDFMGQAPPQKWCLQTDGPGRGDLSGRGTSFKDVSRSWLRQVLSDTTELGATWREVLGGAPQMVVQDSIIEVRDERICRTAAQVINRDVLGWQVGPPPVVVFRIGRYLIVYPSNARLGEFGYAVGMSRDLVIRGVAGW